jgi:hypothetical protein
LLQESSSFSGGYIRVNNIKSWNELENPPPPPQCLQKHKPNDPIVKGSYEKNVLQLPRPRLLDELEINKKQHISVQDILTTHAIKI